MSKKIFNILLVCLLIFITVYFALKISQYGMQLEEADEKAKSGAVSPYSYSTQINK